MTQPLPSDAPAELRTLLDWFQSTVQRLEEAYKDLGIKFEQVNKELEVKNLELIRALREKELTQKRLNALLDSMQTGVVMVDNDLRVTVFNRAAERMLGISSDQCLERLLPEVLPGEGIGKWLQAVKVSKGTLAQEGKVHGPRGDFPIAITVATVQEEGEGAIGAVAVFSDLTELKRMQAEVQQDRVLRALGEMAATVAHEIRNPLGGIGGYAGLLARGIPPEDPRRKLVDKIIQGVSSLNKIVTNLLVYTRKTLLQKVPVDLVEWFEQILSHAELEIEREGKLIHVVRDFPPEPRVVDLDPERFQQVALNLLFNAIQAIPDSGEIHVDMEDQGKWVMVSIQDTGGGIAPDQLSQVFTPFFTTKEQGTGLGLAIVKKLVDLHEGRIEVESTVGVGTIFKIWLPNNNS